MSDAPLAASVGASDLLQVVQSGEIVLATVGQLVTIPMAQLAATTASLVALAARVAALEGRPDPCVALSGTIPIATLQIGSVILAVPVAGLLASDRVAVEPAADLPAGLVLAWAHPSAAGVLTVALTASLVVALKAPVALNVTALR